MIPRSLHRHGHSNVPAVRAVRTRLARQDGFSMAESAIVLLVASVLVLGTSQVLLSTLGAARSLKTSQQATMLASRALEGSRDVPYDLLVLPEHAVAADPRVGPDRTVDPDGSGPLAPESLVTAAAGGISPHITEERVGGVPFTIRRYVTWFASPDGDAPRYKRLIAVLEWTVNGETRSRYANTAVTRTRRGVPVLKFELLPAAQSRSAQQGNQVVFAHTITNHGTADVYDLTAAAPVDRGWQVSYYDDVNGNGELDSSTDTLLVDTDGDAIVDTGRVSTGQVLQFLAVWTLAADEPTGTAVVTVTARSAADPSASATAEDTLTITQPPIGLTLHLHNRPRPPVADTTAQTNLTMDVDAPTAATLYRYSTDVYTANPNGIGGRLLRAGTATATTTDPAVVSNWLFQLNERKTLRGNVTVKLWVANRDHACSGRADVRLWIRDKPSAATSSGTVLSETTVSSESGTGTTCGFRAVTAQLPIDATVRSNRWLELKVAVPTTSASDVVVAYGTSTYDATTTFPQVLR